jgi:hypothetical protein
VPDRFLDALTNPDPAVRDRPLADLAAGLSPAEVEAACDALHAFRQRTDSLYERVRALAYLAALQRDVLLPAIERTGAPGAVPAEGHELLLDRRFEDAIAVFREDQRARGPGEANTSALAAACRGLLFDTLGQQVRRSVQGLPGNRWMFEPREVGSPHPLRLVPGLIDAPGSALVEDTPVRMDLSHSAWSDIFFLAMDDPDGARVINVSIDLAVRGVGAGSHAPRPPVESRLRLIDEPVIELTSVDLAARTTLRTVGEVFDFGADHLGLLRAAVVASGLVPPGVQAAGGSLAPLLEQILGPGRGLSITTSVHGIPKGSRLAVSTNLLASLISAIMRATGQTKSTTGLLDEPTRRLACARALLGEWLGGSGGGWQDSGGLWPGCKRIEGVLAGPDDAEHGISRGRLLPSHHLMGPPELPQESMERLCRSLVLVHGGMAQDVGPVLEMVTERYLLRSEPAWSARRDARGIFDEIHAALLAGDMRRLGAATHANFFGPIRAIVPWAHNAFTEDLVASVQRRFGDDFLGFWMLGGMAGGGMGLLFTEEARPRALEQVPAALAEARAAHDHGLPFAMAPVVYEFAVNQQGSVAQVHPATVGEDDGLDLASPPTHDQLLDDDLGLDAVLAQNGFDAEHHERRRADLLAGRIGLASNRLPATTVIRDAESEDVVDLRGDDATDARRVGEDALAAGEVAVVTLAGGSGTRWTRGAGTVKALSPFVELAGHHRSFVDVHRAKAARSGRLAGTPVPHVVTTSYLTHDALAPWAAGTGVRLSHGSRVGLRYVPTAADLRFAWQETTRARLEEQAQQMQESVEAALMAWATDCGEASDYRDNLPEQCLHPPGHAFELPNLVRNGTLAALLTERPALRTLLVHNVDTVGAWLDPAVLGAHRAGGADFSFEVVPRRVDDRGGGLARVDGVPRLIESVALPREEDELLLSRYSSMTTWVEIDGLLALMGLDRDAVLAGGPALDAALDAFLARLPSYVVLKEVKKRWGRGHEDVFPVLQVEQLWGDVSGLPGTDCAYLLVPTRRGRQLKEPAQLDDWLHDGSAAWVASLCDW